jgi:hypothetical protein
MSGGLQSSGRMFIKKVPGECCQHSPGRYDALASPWCYVDRPTCFQPSPGARRTGAFVLSYSRDGDQAQEQGQRQVNGVNLKNRKQEVRYRRPRPIVPCRARPKRPPKIQDIGLIWWSKKAGCYEAPAFFVSRLYGAIAGHDGLEGTTKDRTGGDHGG